MRVLILQYAHENVSKDCYGVRTATVKFSTVPAKNFASILAFKFLNGLKS